MAMQLIISDFEVKKMSSTSQHIYLSGNAETDLGLEHVAVFFQDRMQEKKVFESAILTIRGDLVRTDAGTHLVNSRIEHVQLLADIPLEGLTIKDRMNASGLIHEFREIYRKDKIRAMEILKVLGVSEKMAEEILLRNSFVLPFI
jgi:hypothetical protein